MSKRFLLLKTEHAYSGILTSSLTAKSLLRAIQELRPAIIARTLGIETSRRIPADIGWFAVDALSSYPALVPWVNIELNFASIASAAGPNARPLTQ
jgi:hypothetical protein